MPGSRFLVPQHETARPRASAVQAEQSRSKALEPESASGPLTRDLSKAYRRKKATPKGGLGKAELAQHIKP
jgi:hypothetical protein